MSGSSGSEGFGELSHIHSFETSTVEIMATSKVLLINEISACRIHVLEKVFIPRLR
jgi:hypothetical protein